MSMTRSRFTLLRLLKPKINFDAKQFETYAIQ